jgi:hypothetical protein
MIQYQLPGTKEYQERIFPNPSLLDPRIRKTLDLRTYRDVILHFTKKSLAEDGILIQDGSLRVSDCAAGYTVGFEPLQGFHTQARHFAEMHRMMLDDRHAGLALGGADACRATPAWNPMAGHPVNSRDGPSEWIPCLPLGTPIANHRAVTLLHYPPLVAYRAADYLNNNTLRRWSRILTCVGIERPELYHAILDVNPIAAPGSGESEYANDYFPINLTSLFFDNDKRGLTYVRSMLELMLNPPANEANGCTLPLLVCGSPLYDPQAPGWFRVRYKEKLPMTQGTPTVDVLQVGFIEINPGSRKKTPYMIANHMIAAGVTGRCTNDPSLLPNIQKYEAQDLVAATFLNLCAAATQKGNDIDPADMKEKACQRWFGAADDFGAPNPPDKNDRLKICALAQVDLCFDRDKGVPMYSYEQAINRCLKKGGADFSPCFDCAPLPSAD